MHRQRDYWTEWSDFLRERGLENFAAWLLEAGSPLGVIGAQLIYMGQPLFSPLIPYNRAEALASLLEDRDESLAFISFLRNGVES
jgi:hypothetical protein